VSSQQPSTAFNQQVGANIRTHRRSRGMSQTELAHELALRGMPFQQQTILKVEKGSRPLRFEEADAIARILGVKDLTMPPLTGLLDMSGSLRQLRDAEDRIARLEARLPELRRELEETTKGLELARQQADEARAELTAMGAAEVDGRWVVKAEE
jgi:transcriptional regulator with XRE-family HTH domain